VFLGFINQLFVLQGLAFLALLHLSRDLLHLGLMILLCLFKLCLQPRYLVLLFLKLGLVLVFPLLELAGQVRRGDAVLEAVLESLFLGCAETTS
jgi:hypothetical protein